MQPLLAGEPNRVGDYRLLARIGGGAMGAVYLARSRGGRGVAIKIVRPELADDGEFRERFRREVEMARSVGGFWTATVIDADTEADQPWLATEYVPGPTLHRAVADHGPLPEQTVRSLAAGLAEALGAIHRAGLVHRDLKPGNVLLGPDGPRVIDFGISRAMSSSALTATGIFLGTPGFFSPEQTVGTDVGPPSDVFSLGAVLMFAATGAGPFGNENTAAMLYRVVHNEPDLDALPPGLRPLIGGCLAKDPAARPTPGQLLDQVGEASPQNDSWLPAEITAVITEHTSQLKQASEAPSAPPAAPPRPTRQRGGGDWSAAPAAPAKPIIPARPKPTAQQPEAGRGTAAPARIAPSRPAVPIDRVRADGPGPVFTTGGRLGALVSAALMFGLIHLVLQIGPTADDELWALTSFGMLLLTISGALSLAKALLPGLRLKVSADGLRVSRSPLLTREIPWSHVSRIAVVGTGKGQSVTVWTRPGSPALRWRIWNPTRPYHGGVRVYPVGSAGGPLTRRQEGRRIRQALQQYARGTYDNRMV
ncbi:serine/threonine-protein kinase [Saccharopolyspora sp. 7B]|uniref:serine/threonine-protein kinase n=1 Tax=Saccharopolyspora sp. 7B TaxID=2877240 RepID=UPI001CD63D1F|nr:serine/threonine-protein kinase [Saccharopolyspora sp. 7B]MCA1279071.1 serine/threonine protein kinase [Saccharopolyspora sp. 7B]